MRKHSFSFLGDIIIIADIRRRVPAIPTINRAKSIKNSVRLDRFRKVWGGRKMKRTTGAKKRLHLCGVQASGQQIKVIAEMGFTHQHEIQ